MTTQKFTIKGLHCPGCAQAAQSALGNMTGVTSAKVDFLSSTLEVSYDESIATPDDLKAFIEKLGYSLEG